MFWEAIYLYVCLFLMIKFLDSYHRGLVARVYLVVYTGRCIDV